jgi:DNA replication protein DnaC
VRYIVRGDVGKTHLAVALGIQAIDVGSSVLVLTLETLMGRLIQARQENRLERMPQQLAAPRLLYLDEFGVSAVLARGGQPVLPAAGPPLRAR